LAWVVLALGVGPAYQKYSCENFLRHCQWHHNTGGTELDWRKMKNKEELKLIEDVFLETRAKQL
jgi:hypothetical protein